MRRRTQNLALLAGAAALSGVLYLFTGPGSAPDPPPELESLRYVDGTLTVVEQRRLVLDPYE